MGADDAISLCPMCRMAPVARARPWLGGLVVGRMECPACGATYRPAPGRRIRLTWANPRKIVAMGASANPMAPPVHGYRGYYLGHALPREEWERIAGGLESDAFRQWMETSARYARGDLDRVPAPAGVSLREGESVHHVASPAWISLSSDPIGGVDPAPGALVVTSLRLLFQADRLSYQVALDNMDDHTEMPPAILVRESGAAEPVVFFVHPLDPAFGAIRGAWKRARDGT